MFRTLALILSMAFLGSEFAHAQLAYFSDYFSFVGQDDQRRVAFALDTNRGQDGDTFQAEHFVVLHDEPMGWAEIKGNGAYPNVGKALEALPNSVHFQFSGTPSDGMKIESPSNKLSLSIDPIPTHLKRKNGNDHYWMGAAAATLKWQGRTLKGRVIYEYIQFDNWNHLTRTYFGFWKNFHGLYLAIIGSEGEWRGDFYIHTQQSEKLAPLVGKIDGFATIDRETIDLSKTQMETTDTTFALGFYRWPRSWKGILSESDRELIFEAELTQIQKIANWVLGGFAMGIVNGSLQYKGKQLEVYGLGEIIK